MARSDYSRIFTIEVDGRPVVAFEAVTAREAQQLAKEQWLLEDLAAFTSGGAPLSTPRSRLFVRLATAQEAIVFAGAATAAKKTRLDELFLAYLVALDK